MGEILDRIAAEIEKYAQEQVSAKTAVLITELHALQSSLTTTINELSAERAMTLSLKKRIEALEAAAAPVPEPIPAPVEPVPTQPMPPPIPMPQWKLIWTDPFDKLDTTIWTPDVASSYGSGNLHSQINTNRPKNLRVENGSLIFQAHPEDPPLKVTQGTDPLIKMFPEGRPFSSANMKSKKTFRFGKTPIRFDVRAKLPLGPGFLPCPLWLRPTSGGTDGEIDLVESETKDAYSVVQTVHQSYTQAPRNSAKVTKLTTPVTEWHTYSVEVWPDRIEYFIDGKPTHKVTQKELNRYPDLFGVDRDWLMRISLAVGGTWVGQPTSMTKFPATMEVGYIRVFGLA